MRGEQENFTINARTPEMKEKIERERPIFERALEILHERARALYESTGDAAAAIGDAAKEAISHLEREKEES